MPTTFLQWCGWLIATLLWTWELLCTVMNPDCEQYITIRQYAFQLFIFLSCGAITNVRSHGYIMVFRAQRFLGEIQTQAVHGAGKDSNAPRAINEMRKHEKVHEKGRNVKRQIRIPSDEKRNQLHDRKTIKEKLKPSKYYEPKRSSRPSAGYIES